jgi:hypothetical protein
MASIASPILSIVSIHATSEYQDTPEHFHSDHHLKSATMKLTAFSILFALVASVVALPATPCAACLAYCGNGALDSQSCRLCEEDNCA